MKHGRPTLNDQKKIKEIIFSYYENNIEAITASRKTGINYKTILKYYSHLNKEMFASEKNDFLTRLKITKEKNILMFDNTILSLVKEQKQIQSQLNQTLLSGDLFNFEKLSNLNLKTREQLLKVLSSKTNLIGTPTADIIIEQQEKHDE
jgi:hypothetical protein